MADGIDSFDFGALVDAIMQADRSLADQGRRAVNVSLTLRNWLIGAYIAEYELSGADRATYGDKLLDELAKNLHELEISNCNRRQLYRYLRFYRNYPEIVGALSPQLKVLFSAGKKETEKVGIGLIQSTRNDARLFVLMVWPSRTKDKRPDTLST
jgi:hypothetical protein